MIVTVHRRRRTAFSAAIVIILTFTAGTALMMWLGEQINQKWYWQRYFYYPVCRYRSEYALYPVYITWYNYFIARMQIPGASWQILYSWYRYSLLIFLGLLWVIVFHERRRAQNSDSICKTCCWQKNVSAARAPIFQLKLAFPVLCRLSSQAQFFPFQAPSRCSWVTL